MPTLFSPLLAEFEKNVRESSETKNCYEIMMILTDGLCFDMPEIKKLLVSIS